MMNNSLDDVPADMYDQLKVGPGSVATPELLRARNEKEFLHPNLYETVIATSCFRDNHLIRIELHPVDLGVNDKSASRCVPHIAAPFTAKRIQKRIQALSARMIPHSLSGTT